jgi:D-alanyl-D-alanine carboxypeptidase/D-alanyl-D-alanine-endopeptidase (penicillin-binding protein 4)
MKASVRLVALLLLISFCHQAVAQKRYKKRHILKDLKALDGFKQAFVGFALYDPETGKTLACQNDGVYMTPASNTKLFTFYAGLKLLGKAVPALQYTVQGDSLIFWGTGNPLFLHPELDDKAALDFLNARTEKLYYWKRPIKDNRFGPGWGWDDYNGYYSAEKAIFPMYGNSISAYLDRNQQSLRVVPDYFKPNFSKNTEAEPSSRSRVTRTENENAYTYQIGEAGDTDKEEIDTLIRPFLYTDNLFIELLSDTLNKAVNFYHGLPQIGAARTLYSLPTDTLYKQMLQPSDNLFAEQILLMASGLENDTLSTVATIDKMQAEVFQEWTDKPVWVDGSGLSRYNMFTPRTMIRLLRTLREEVGETRLFELLPAGGQSGTIEDWYAGEDGPFVYAKTGTLSNNHALSGYIKTDSGKTLIFTIMVNHYAHSTSNVRESMGVMLEKIKKAY